MENIDCSVKGCRNRNDVTGIGDVYLCGWHRKRWQDFFMGYEAGHYGDDGFERHGRLNKKRWHKAMTAFLEWCSCEIAACIEIAEATSRVTGQLSCPFPGNKTRGKKPREQARFRH